MWVSKNIEKRGKKFFLFGSNSKYLGCVSRLKGERVFITHVKIPEKHFYIKGRGYPINEELLKVLRRARIEHILIPEDGKRGFKVWMGKVSDYLNGERIIEPMTEPQMSIPIDNLVLTKVTKENVEILMRSWVETKRLKEWRG